MRKVTAIAALATTCLAGTAYVGAAEQRVVLAVDNMTCASCPIVVKRILARVPGVRSVEVSYERKTATVAYDDRRVSVAELLEATTTAGYPARIAGSGGQP
jgi:mercuric ion binding protein